MFPNYFNSFQNKILFIFLSLDSIQKNYQNFTTLMMVFLCLFLFYSSSDQIWYHLFAVAHSFPQKGTKLINSMAKHHYAAVGNLTKENCTFGSSNLNGNGWPTVNLSWFFNKSHRFPISPTIVGRTGISNIESNTEIRNRHFYVWWVRELKIIACCLIVSLKTVTISLEIMTGNMQVLCFYFPFIISILPLQTQTKYNDDYWPFSAQL